MRTHNFLNQLFYNLLAIIALLASHCSITHATTSLADMPIFAVGSNIPGNLALALSVEFPTAVVSSYRGGYDQNTEYLGYFDPNKCYLYQAGLITPPYNTGVDSNRQLLANGALDPNWTVSPQPNAMRMVNTNIGMASRGSGQPIGGVPNNNGTFSYRTTFTIPVGVDPKTVILSFELAYDDAAIVYVNNSPTGYSFNNYNPGYGDPAQITLNQSNSTFVVGTNTIRIDITNNGGGAGLAVSNMTVTTLGTTDASQSSYFYPTNAATNHACSGKWSGNLLNWALTQAIDSFRSSMTGGYRSVDTTTTSILEKAWFPPPTFSPTAPRIVNNRTLISQSTPYTNLDNLYIDFQCTGNNFYFSGTEGSVGNKFGGGYLCSPTINAPLIHDNATPAAGVLPSTTNVYQMRARVKVCDAAVGLEQNCVKYGNNYKPEGLLQKYSKNLNYAAFAYLNDNGVDRQGAALRAKMAPIGPVIASPSGDLANTAEWDTTTGVYKTNPIPSDISTSDANMGVTNSGLLNYVNKFGLASKKYKFEDPVAELYYATLRYLKNQSYVPEYTNGLDNIKLDGFPAIINNWNINPIKYACQRNFILGLGDTNSNRDANVPGAIPNEAIGYGRPIPASVSSDTSFDARAYTNKLGVMENAGYGNTLADINYPWGFTGSYRVAGLAYYAHTNDISSAFAGTQTITTYWLDVLEGGDYFNVGGLGKRNHFWLTAKYGGFTGNDPVTGPLAQSQWDTNNDGDPDTYFRANNPLVMKASLERVFSNIVNTVVGASNSFAASAPSIQNGTLTYAASYNSNGWTGDVKASITPVDNTGTIGRAANAVWSAATQLESQNWDTGRFIATTNPSKVGCAAATSPATGTRNNCGTPFRFSSLSSPQLNVLSYGNATNQQNILNFLRGDTTNEGTIYRDRVQKLGDIVNSKLVAVGPPNKPYIDAFNPGYDAFKSNLANRRTVVYVGANDGMLHAFDGRNNATNGGKELFAYIPNATFNGPNNTPDTDGLASLASISYAHRYFVDATPIVTDVDFSSNGTNWRTILVGGLGKGGRAYFALNVTNPASLSNETNLSQAVLWEFTHPNMGFSYDTPLVIKVNTSSWLYTSQSGTKSPWVVVLTSGYNNTSNNNQGSLFFVKPRDGSLIAEVKTPIIYGSDAGLAHVNAFVADARSGLADAVYAGDLFGNVWRLDITQSSAQTPVRMAAFGSTQPITTSPVIELDTNTGKRFVFVGTGKLLDSGDMSNTATQTFYAIRDGSVSGFFGSTNNPLPAGISFPIGRSNMVDNTNSLTTGVTETPSKPMGYYIDLPSNGGKPYFINVEMASAAGTVAFVANSVNNADVCKPVGSNITYQIQYGNGQSVQTNSNGNLISYIENIGTGLATDVQYTMRTFTDSLGNVRNDVGLIVCDDTGNCYWRSTKNASTRPFTQLNWRELPTAD